MEAFVQRGFYRALGGDWAKADPDAAFAWAGSLGPELKQTVVESIVNEVASQDPEFAKNLLERLPTEQRTARSIERVVQRWAEIDPASAARWSFSQPEDRRGGFSSAAGDWMGTDPHGFSQWLTTNPAVLESDHSLIGGMWSYDRTLAEDFVASLPATEANSKVVKSLSEIIAYKNVSEAIAFAARMQNSEARISAVESVAKSGIYQYPGQTLQWIDTLNEVEQMAAKASLLSNGHAMKQDAERIAEKALEWLTEPGGEILYTAENFEESFKLLAESLAATSLEKAQASGRQTSHLASLLTPLSWGSRPSGLQVTPARLPSGSMISRQARRGTVLRRNWSIIFLTIQPGR